MPQPCMFQKTQHRHCQQHSAPCLQKRQQTKQDTKSTHRHDLQMKTKTPAFNYRAGIFFKNCQLLFCRHIIRITIFSLCMVFCNKFSIYRSILRNKIQIQRQNLSVVIFQQARIGLPLADRASATKCLADLQTIIKRV